MGPNLQQDVSFSCSAYGGPLNSNVSLLLDWSLPKNVDNNFINSETVNDIVDSNLTFTNVTEDNEGDYSCNVAYSDTPDYKSTSETASLIRVSKYTNIIIDILNEMSLF